SYRTIRDLGEKLVLARDPKSGSPVYQATNKSFDEALFEVLIASYAVYEDKTIPKELANIATTMGLLLEDKIRGEMTKWITPETFDERKKTFEEHKEDFKAIAEKIRGMSKNMDATVLPASRTF
ncbi:MAG: hypothetical protein Q8P27_03620, partial [Candidatus Peregrinibacteria bacterium]|nr:hypothetical protein [Candidatus Peregrinibacteria bacterium]